MAGCEGDAIVAVDEISVLRAAGGVIAEIIHDLHTRRTPGFFQQHRETQTEERSDLEISWSHYSVSPVKGGRHSRNPGSSMLTLQSVEALTLALVRRFNNQRL